MADTSLLVTDGQYSKVPKYMVAAVSSWMGSIALGTVIGYTANAIPSLQDRGSHVPMTTDEVSWLGSLMALGAVFGSITAGSSIEYIGRKGTLLFTSLPFLLGWLLMAYAGRMESPIVLLIGRFITGFCCGLVSLSAPVYIAETANPSKRGFLGAGFQLSVTIGVLLAFILGKYMTWAWLAVVSCIFPILLMLGMCLMPETPYWLIKNGRISEATEANIYLHGLDAAQSLNVDASTNSMASDGLQSEDRTLSVSELKKRHVFLPIFLTLCLMFFQQFSGVNALIFYTTSIFANSGSSALSPTDATIIVGAVQVVATLVACLIIDRAGRRPLMIVSSVGCGLAILMLSIFHFLGDTHGDQFLQKYGWIPVVSLISFMIAFSFGLGPIPWLLMGEMLPSHVKSLGSGLCASFNWLCAFLITKLFHTMIDGLHESGTYLMLSIICFKCCLFVVFLLPETKGKSLTEIEGLFRRPAIN